MTNLNHQFIDFNLIRRKGSRGIFGHQIASPEQFSDTINIVSQKNNQFGTRLR